MKAKIGAKIGANISVIGLLMAGAETECLTMQLIVSTAGVCIFAGAGWLAVNLLGKEEDGNY